MTSPIVESGPPPAPLVDRGPVGRRLPALTVAAGGAAVLCVAGAWSTSGVTSGPVTCLFRHFTGLPCPGCGLTRSFVMLAHGDVSKAFGYNLMGPFFFAVIVASVALALWVLLTGKTRAISQWGDLVFGKVGLTVVGLWLVYGVVRMISAGAGLGWFPPVA